MIRTTILLSKSKVASFMDESLGPDVARVLDTTCFECPEEITDIAACSFYSVALAKSGVFYWW